MLFNRTTFFSLKWIIVIFSLTTLFSSCTRKASQWKPADVPLQTRWAKNVSPENVLPEYPRPQMVRQNWQNLNGLWDYTLTKKEDGVPTQFDGSILVPFPIESALSGVGKRITEKDRIYYRTTFTVPSDWKNQRVLLHFGAVDWEIIVYVNGKTVGTHRGGYDPFSFDITNALQKDGPQELIVSVWDPTNKGGQPVGKQTTTPGGIWYTPTSGIWQTVWLEPVAETFIERFFVTPDVDKKCLKLTVNTGGANAGSLVYAVALADGKTVGEASAKPDETFKINLADVKLWSPASPYLYDLKIILKDDSGAVLDSIKSYFAMRKIAVGKDKKGITRLMLNGKFVFQLGPLDQGFWPDGLYTAPTYEALRYDLEITKKMGFNMVRKHVKVEPDRWYYFCDKMGLLVWQDMPSGKNITSADKKQFELELKRMITGLYNHPSIIMWVPFNEGWGQYDSRRITEEIKALDPSRLVDHASGWTDRGVGDVHDIHSYPDPKSPDPEPKRAAVLGEFGGLGFIVPDHAWNPKGWGYDVLQDSNGLLLRYENLYKQLLPLIQKPGLSAAVYTQTTDVETENNGLMTYDRKVIKMRPKSVSLAHQGYFPPERKNKADIFITDANIELYCWRDGAKIYYTLDGSEPTQKSLVYSQPIHLTKTTEIKTRAFWANGVASRVNTFSIRKVVPVKSVKVEKTRPGLNVSYYEGQWRQFPDFEKLNPVMTTVAKSFDLSVVKRDKNYALKFMGLIKIPVTGVYVFYTTSDEGSRLFIDDKEIVINIGLYGKREKYGAIALEAGMHPITLLFFQRSGGQMLQVSYEGPGIPKQQISRDMLMHKVFD
ncbi:MAG: glycoside hydrolase family 2 [Actinobacteria bacterium]|nr:glycoside hydrolase family 2 [Actinomycetota bacterium]